MRIITISGSTGTGKSNLAARLALAVGGEVVNYDSVQIYRGFDIGSAKPGAELRSQVPHHLFDLIDADQEFNAADYARIARARCEEIVSRGRIPILAGGTFFYLRALLSGLPEMPGRSESVRRRLRAVASRPRGPAHLYAWLTRVDPVSGSRIAPADRHRIERALEVRVVSGRPISDWSLLAEPSAGFEATRIALKLERPRLVEVLDRRVEEMYDRGIVEETRALIGRFGSHARPFAAIGYKEAVAILEGRMTRAEAVAETRRRTRAYAKRQMTWLRSEQNMHWLDATSDEETFRAAMRLIEG